VRRVDGERLAQKKRGLWQGGHVSTCDVNRTSGYRRQFRSGSDRVARCNRTDLTTFQVRNSRSEKEVKNPLVDWFV
jgi:hypothetical protein